MTRGRASAVSRCVLFLHLVLGAAVGAERAEVLPQNTALRIHVIRVGQGDATLLVTASGSTMLIDAGPQSSSACASSSGIVTYLASIGLQRLDYFVASHYDADHIGCADEVLARWPVQRAVLDRGATNVPTTQTYLTYAAATASVRQTAILGQEVWLDAAGTVRLEVIAVNGNGRSLAASNQNDRGLVMRLRSGEFDALFGGDVSATIEADIASAAGRVELYKVHHHGSRTSSSRAFVEVLRPRVATLSLGSPNGPGHPDAEVLQVLRDVGAVTYWTTPGDDSPPVPPHDVVVNGSFEVAVPQGGHSFRVEYLDDWDQFAAWGSEATLAVSPSALSMTAVKRGTTLVTTSGPAAIQVTSANGWTAEANVDWLSVTPRQGPGNGVIEVRVVNPGDVIGNQTALVGRITLTAPGASPAVVDVPVVLGVSQNTSGPFGQTDTPVQGSTGVQGGIAMTGWVLDDVGIQHVRIYRQCLSFDNQAACQTVLGTNVVFVGEASVISGARPDVEALYPSLPAANSAGWGFLILSNLLPNIPALSSSGGGVGAFTLYAVATDVEGNQKLLGRTVNDATPTTVSVANDTIAKPFGAIDTPGQGATVSGVLNNFGWVLTPDPGSTVLVPTDGSTINVFIDGAVVGTATYNLCRGTVGNPVPAGTLCDDDVSSIFRSAGSFRNLDAARGPIGLRTINTTTLTNGLHTISWGVTDSANRSEGIGSRYFNVLNSSADACSSAECVGRSAEGGVRSAGVRSAGVRSAEVRGREVFARTGYDLATAYVPLEPNADGVPQVRIPEHGRVELRLPGVSDGALIVNGEARALPVGVGIDGEQGLVTWVAGPGYLGTYRLRFGATEVDVTVAPAPTVDEPVRMHVDRVDQQGSTFTLHGWALDPQASIGSGIGAVHIWARKKTSGVFFVGTADMGGARPDVAAAHGARFPNAGFAFTGVLPEAGEWEITAYIWNSRTGRFEDARTMTVVVR